MKSETQSDRDNIESIREGYKLEYDNKTPKYSVVNPVGDFIGKFNSDDVENAIEEDFNKRFDDVFGTEDIVFEETDEDSEISNFFDKLALFK